MGSYRVTRVNDGPAPFHVDAEEDGTGNTLTLRFPDAEWPPIEVGTSVSVSYTAAPRPEPPPAPELDDAEATDGA